MSLFGRILGSEKATNAGIAAIDAMFHTDQEKAEDKKQYLKLYEPFKVAQRYIALIFCPPYALAAFITFIASFFMENVDAQLDILGGTLGYIVLTIVGFYFGGGLLEGAIKKFKK